MLRRAGQRGLELDTWLEAVSSLHRLSRTKTSRSEIAWLPSEDPQLDTVIEAAISYVDALPTDTQPALRARVSLTVSSLMTDCARRRGPSFVREHPRTIVLMARLVGLPDVLAGGAGPAYVKRAATQAQLCEEFGVVDGLTDEGARRNVLFDELKTDVPRLLGHLSSLLEAQRIVEAVGDGLVSIEGENALIGLLDRALQLVMAIVEHGVGGTDAVKDAGIDAVVARVVGFVASHPPALRLDGNRRCPSNCAKCPCDVESRSIWTHRLAECLNPLLEAGSALVDARMIADTDLLGALAALTGDVVRVPEPSEEIATFVRLLRTIEMIASHQRARTILSPVVLEASVVATDSLNALLTAKRVREAVRHARDAWLGLVAAADGTSALRLRYCAECAGPNGEVDNDDVPSQFCTARCWQRCVIVAVQVISDTCSHLAPPISPRRVAFAEDESAPEPPSSSLCAAGDDTAPTMLRTPSLNADAKPFALNGKSTGKPSLSPVTFNANATPFAPSPSPTLSPAASPFHLPPSPQLHVASPAFVPVFKPTPVPFDSAAAAPPFVPSYHTTPMMALPPPMP